MKNVLLLIFSIIILSCSNTNCNSDIESIKILENQDTEVDLWKGIHTTHFFNQKDNIIRFSVSEKEISSIKEIYAAANICSYGNEILIQDDSPLIMPATEIKYIIKFNTGKTQLIIIRTDFQNNPLNIKGNERMKKFIYKIDQVLKNKKELKNLSKSDFFLI